MIYSETESRPSVMFQQRSRYMYKFLSFIQVTDIKILSANIVLMDRVCIYIQPIFATCQLPDSWVNTAIQQVCHSGLTGLETSWSFLTYCRIGSVFYQVQLNWNSDLLQSFQWINLDLRNCSKGRPRCSLLGQLQLEFSACAEPTWQCLTRLTESDSLDRVKWILAHPIGAWVLP